MFDFDPSPKQQPTDWSGTIIGVLLLPVLFFFIFIGKPEFGFSACIVLAAFMVAVRVHWQLRRQIWFWPVVILLLALHVPLLFIVRWPETNVPTIVYSLPMGLVDVGLVMGAMRLAESLFPNSREKDPGSSR